MAAHLKPAGESATPLRRRIAILRDPRVREIPPDEMVVLSMREFGLTFTEAKRFVRGYLQKMRRN